MNSSQNRAKEIIDDMDLSEDIKSKLEVGGFHDAFWDKYGEAKDGKSQWDVLCREVSRNVRNILPGTEIVIKEEREKILNEFKLRFLLQDFPEIWERISQIKKEGKRFPSISQILTHVFKGQNIPFQWDTLIKIAQKSWLEPLLVELLLWHDVFEIMDASIEANKSQVFLKHRNKPLFVQSDSDVNCLYDYEAIMQALLLNNEEWFQQFCDILKPVLDNFKKPFGTSQPRITPNEMIQNVYYTGWLCLWNHERLVLELFKALESQKRKAF